MESKCTWANQEESLKIRSQVSQAMSGFPFDIVVHIRGGRVRGHYRNLAAFSPVMKKLIMNATGPEIHLPRIPERIFKIILVYVYIERAVFKTCDAIDLLEAAYELQMEGLQDICIKRLKEEMNVDMVMDCLHMAFKHGIVDLKSKCGEILYVHFADIVVAPEFLTLSPAELQWYLSLLLGNVANHLLENALCRWLLHSHKTREDTLSNALVDYSLLRLLNLQ